MGRSFRASVSLEFITREARDKYEGAEEIYKDVKSAYDRYHSSIAAEDWLCLGTGQLERVLRLQMRRDEAKVDLVRIVNELCDSGVAVLSVIDLGI